MQRGQLWNVPFARLVAATVKQPPTKELCRKQNKTYFLLKETNLKKFFLVLYFHENQNVKEKLNELLLWLET